MLGCTYLFCLQNGMQAINLGRVDHPISGVLERTRCLGPDMIKASKCHIVNTVSGNRKIIHLLSAITGVPHPSLHAIGPGTFLACQGLHMASPPP
ncbi:hypothetical protein XELAEV_18013398mg [Xenopus laevis]|uniref:Uncharacterized protein n=1 Tax=Xenopus laevis TaxID=8355 RepID=A0A974DQH6_XENLA|nr:hypothetical protein XELAEV_18013398mg [Xenopus laevis]